MDGPRDVKSSGSREERRRANLRERILCWASFTPIPVSPIYSFEGARIAHSRWIGEPTKLLVM
ncbi:hypothetical protein HanXRQr2_Chr08g0322881 [Helianthus annuus]|uniref:Uncharacterized protein n=1 Tax=Helianthus annuus TaxID=4232 RepID=A0A9K3NB44_HELAN|nr:hypothetical protein HanXRQr2_Chr08g0322881 [Helianthus annuus]KAJ0891469.1 hypothetical protein HanPSC8_Chr09g0354131 [Helianthus annuus]